MHVTHVRCKRRVVLVVECVRDIELSETIERRNEKRSMLDHDVTPVCELRIIRMEIGTPVLVVRSMVRVGSLCMRRGVAMDVWHESICNLVVLKLFHNRHSAPAVHRSRHYAA